MMRYDVYEMKMYEECKMHEMYLLEIIFAKRNFIYPIKVRTFKAWSTQVYYNSKKSTSKMNTSKSSVHLNLLHRSV